jgi:L-fuculose-phosphate aldolase
LAWEDARRRVLAVAQAMFREGLVRGTAGNVSARTGDGELVVITPTGMAYDRLAEEDLVVVDLAGRPVAGTRRPSSELPMHTRVYRDHPGVGGIVHTHSPCATAFAVARQPIPAAHYLIALVGDGVPVVPYVTYGTEQLGAAAAAGLAGRRAVLLANHGVLAVGGSVEEALRNAMVVEFVAEVCLRAHVLGGPRALSGEDLASARRQLEGYGQQPDSAVG